MILPFLDRELYVIWTSNSHSDFTVCELLFTIYHIEYEFVYSKALPSLPFKTEEKCGYSLLYDSHGKARMDVKYIKHACTKS